MSEKMKSSYELAMERLRQRDREQGVEGPAALTTQQKRQIAELRDQAKAKRAELEILLQQRLASTQGDPEKLAEEKRNYETDLRRIDSSLESAIRDVKK